MSRCAPSSLVGGCGAQLGWLVLLLSENPPSQSRCPWGTPAAEHGLAGPGLGVVCILPYHYRQIVVT